MSQFERIDQVLTENDITGMGLNLAPALIYSNIRKAMEQYGKEMYTNGCNTTYRIHEDILADCDIIINDNKRLRSLVKAQKELIVSLGKLSLDEPLTSKEWDRMDELRNQIKKLES